MEEEKNTIEYIRTTQLINAETGKPTGIPVHHFKRTYPNTFDRAYWDRKLVETIKNDYPECFSIAPKKRTLRQKIKDWFAHRRIKDKRSRR